MLPSPSSGPIRVLVVDDSAVVRRMVGDALNAKPDIEVVGQAADPYLARDQIKAVSPDVITLDVDGLFKYLPPAHSPHAIAGVPTATGKDGADGLNCLSDLGALTFAQDEASSVVYGMPREAWEFGSADHRVSIDRETSHILRLCSKPVRIRSHVHA